MSAAAELGSAVAPPEPEVLAAGRRLLNSLPPERRFSAERLNAVAVDRIASDPALRAALFRLVDVTPMCRDLDDVAAHLAALLGEIEDPEFAARVARSFSRRLPARAVGFASRTGVKSMASRFIAGSGIDEATDGFARLWIRGVASTVDLLGEATVTEGEADQYVARCMDTLRRLAGTAAGWPERANLELDRHGRVPRVNLSVKVSAMTPNARADAPERGARGAADRLRRLLREAAALDAHLHIDMESLDLRDTVTSLVFDLLGDPEFRDGPSVGMVLQGYLIDSPEELESWLDWQRGSGRTVPLTIRLVKGAYWDHEVVEAAQAGWKAPVFTDRGECDRNFEVLTRSMLAADDLLRPVVASHNLRSISHALAAAEHMRGSVHAIEFQVLRGLGDDIQDALAALGLRVRTYSPVGDLIAGMAYLVRRLLENTSNDSFLRVRAGTDDLESLLVAP